MAEELLTPSSLLLQMKKLVGKPLTYPSGKGECMIINIQLPEGPIVFKRRSDSTQWALLKEEHISSAMVWRVVNALNTKIPIQIDRVLGASYNSRSVLETLIACCPNFFICRPNRYTIIGGQVQICKGHKHLLWKPDEAHEAPCPSMLDVRGYITEVPSVDIYCDAINVSTPAQKTVETIDPEIRRMHSQMQVALCEGAKWFEMRPWIAVEDHGIQYQGKNILQFPNIVNDLHKERVISNFPDAIKVAKHVDCLWFNGGMPFAFEVEHSTGVTSGLTRMNALRTQMEFSRTDYVIVADDNARNDVLKKASDPQFDRMDLWYMPYSAVSEMHAFTIRHRNRGVNRDFMKSFMEQLNEY